MKYLNLLLLSTLSLFLFSACDNNSEEAAKIQVALIDAPADYESVFIDIEDVQVNPTGDESNGWESLEGAQPGRYDILKLTNGEEAFLGEISLPEGKLSQIRLILGSDNQVVVDGVALDLSTPSASQSGLKLNVNADIVAGVTYKLILDFDAGKSVVEAGNSGRYNLKPVIRAAMEAQTGSIQGVVSPADVKAIVYAIAGSDSVSTYPAEDGSFLIRALDAGQYTVVAIPAADSGLSKATSDAINVIVGESATVDTLLME